MRQFNFLVFFRIAFNEARLIAASLQAIASALGGELAGLSEIIIVDDGTDDLPSVVKGISPGLSFAKVCVLRSPVALGKGKALARGFEQARAPYAGFLDADLSTPAAYIPEALAILRRDAADIVIASRRAEGSQVHREQSRLKDILGKALAFVSYYVLFSGGPRYRDTQCGFKFFKKDISRILYRDLLAADGMSDIEVLLRANKLGYRVQELAVTWTDTRPSKRPLHRTLLSDLKAIFVLALRYRIPGESVKGIRNVSGAENAIPGAERGLEP